MDVSTDMRTAAENMSVMNVQRLGPVHLSDLRNEPWIHVEFFVTGFSSQPSAGDAASTTKKTEQCVKMLAGSKGAGFESTRT